MTADNAVILFGSCLIYCFGGKDCGGLWLVMSISISDSIFDV